MPQPTKIEKRTTCPSCGNKGRSVSAVTLRALLNDEHIAPFEAKEQSCCESDGASADGCKPNREDTGWRFCESASCDVVYFGERGETTLAKSDLDVEVGVKETNGERPLCYCFGHSVASIKQELLAKGESDALEDIRKKMTSPGCRCETENPSGLCCLGSVAKGIMIAKDELGVAEVAADTKTLPPRSSASRGEFIAKAGTVVSAIMASACCWLPLVLLAVGVSGAGIAATLETYRPVFIVVTFGFLAAAFYFTYRPRKPAQAGRGCCPSDATSAADDCCETEGGRRFSMMTMNKAMLWVVTVLAIGFLFFPSYVGALLGTDDSAKVTENMNTVVFKIDGMTCEGCASIADKAIRDVPGVLAVEVDYEKGQAVVGMEICCPIPPDEIIAALREVGYEARTTDPDPSLQDLSSDAREFKEAFNAAKGKVRIVMLVSPGRPMCQDGARLVDEKVINQIKNSRLQVFAIWTPRYPGDNRDRAVASSSIVSDSRATHFWDAAGYLPSEYGWILSLPEDGQFAWDTYMIFSPAAEWTESPPPPDDWMHQMSKGLGPNHPRWFNGDKLRLAVDRLLTGARVASD